jgi:hypothetical protein
MRTIRLRADPDCDLRTLQLHPRRLARFTYLFYPPAPHGCETRGFFLSRDRNGRGVIARSLRSSSGLPERQKRRRAVFRVFVFVTADNRILARREKRAASPLFLPQRATEFRARKKREKEKCSTSNQSTIVGTWRP